MAAQHGEDGGELLLHGHQSVALLHLREERRKGEEEAQAGRQAGDRSTRG